MVLEIEFPGHARCKSVGNVELSAVVAALPVVLRVVVVFVVVNGVDNVHNVIDDCMPLLLR